MNSIIDKAQRLSLTIAPELAAAPLYILDAAEYANTGLDPRGCHGCAYNELWWYPLADTLGDRYYGPGPMILLYLDDIAADVRPGFFDQAVLSITCHELAHILPPQSIRQFSDTPEIRALQHEFLMLSRDVSAPKIEADAAHDWRFLRRYMHLFTRAADAGWNVHIRGGWATYWGTGMCAERYQAAVEPEARSMKHMTFAEIERTPPPQELLSLWREDLDFVAHLRKGRRHDPLGMNRRSSDTERGA